MQLLYAPDRESPAGDTPPPRSTEALRLTADAVGASQRRLQDLIERFGVDLRDWFIVPRGAWVVTTCGDVETWAGAEVGDLAVLCDVPDSRLDLDASVKSFENFRGVYTSRSEPKVRCYYFAPLQK